MLSQQESTLNVCLHGGSLKNPCAPLQNTEQQETTVSYRKGLRSPGLHICGGLFCTELEQQHEHDPAAAACCQMICSTVRRTSEAMAAIRTVFLLFYNINATLTLLLTLRSYFYIKHFLYKVSPLVNIPSENISAHLLT